MEKRGSIGKVGRGGGGEEKPFYSPPLAFWSGEGEGGDGGGAGALTHTHEPTKVGREEGGGTRLVVGLSKRPCDRCMLNN